MPSVVLKITYADLELKLKHDHQFASQLYRAFALTAERRLRRRVESLTDPELGFRRGALQGTEEGKPIAHAG